MAQLEIELSDGKKAGETLQELTKSANRLNSEIKKLKPGTEEFVNKSKDLKLVGDQIGEVKNQIKGTTEASNGLKDAFDKYVPFSGTFKKIGESLGFAKKGVGGLSGSFGTLRGAIVATGIGALVVLLGSLISYFTSTQEGIDKVTAVTRPLSAIFERLKGVLQELGGKTFKVLSDAIKNPMQAFKDLGNIIQENILNRFKALALFGPAIKKILGGDISGGFKDLGNAVLQVGTGVENVIDKIVDGAKEVAKWVQEGIDAGTRLDQLQKRIERAELNQIVRAKELELLIKQQKAIVEDITKSYDERIAAAQKARAAQDEFEKNEVALLDLKIAKIREQQALNDTSRADEKELAELIAKRLEVQAKIAEQSIEFDKKISEIRILQRNEELAAQQRLQEEIKAIEDLRLQAAEESRQRDLEELQLNLQRQIEILDEHSPLYGEHLAAIQAAARKQRSDINAEWDKKDLDAAKKQAEEEKKIAEDKAKFQQEMNNLINDAAADSFSFAAELIEKGATNEKEAKRLRKAAAVSEIGINLFKEKAANAAAAAANPLNATTFGAAGAAQLTAANIASTIRAAVATVRVLAFRKGGDTGSGRNDDVAGLVHKNEYVVPAEIYHSPAYSPLVDVLESARLRGYQVGGPVNPLSQSSGSSSQRPSSPSGGSGGPDMVGLLSEMLGEIKAWPQKLKVQNVATETEDVIRTINTIKDEANA